MRKKFRAETLYRGWEEFHRPPEKPIGLFAFVGNWGKEPYGGSGYLKQNTAHYLANLKRMRAVLDNHGMKEAQIYFWVMLYDHAEGIPNPEAGWGRFPLDAQDLKDFYADLRREVHDLRLGVYVNFWLCSVKAQVYRDHPEWFTSEFHNVDSGGDSYAGKLPEWGDYLAGEIPAVLEASGKSLVEHFADKPGFIVRWPVHFYDELNEHVMKDFFVPFVKKRAAAMGGVSSE